VEADLAFIDDAETALLADGGKTLQNLSVVREEQAPAADLAG
jgi:hypothetical protein